MKPIKLGLVTVTGTATKIQNKYPQACNTLHLKCKQLKTKHHTPVIISIWNNQWL